MTNLTLTSEYKSFGGKLGFYSHASSTCNVEMRFAVYQPPQALQKPVPVLYFLSGLTSTEENFMMKAGAQRYAAEYGLMLVAPDTSPRNTGIPGEDDDWDFGTGAGFYVDATEEPWHQHYQMYSYVVQELPALIAANFPAQIDKQGIFGHSMGGHGALVCALRNPQLYKSVSAFAPIVAPMRSPWGQKVFSGYLGSNQESWRLYDASELVKQAKYHSPILIDQGTADKYLTDQLLPEVFVQACAEVNQPLTLRYQEGYDHGYYFIASFIEDHIRYHAIALEKSQ
ncbi:S-formylglutathione hydrolase [Nostoc sp. CENA67]|uniref:S-formylglutathione hydrolase n=1 Tax=Amazonocrinis nigriterrae CENA67 TaxID=2794033 RepID=A0A8J7HNY4_9NOST|nr:S-formylglutathione hydrolase [Amazonocrinis nigriterrae]MBH8563186.1 S-formylglutathione hydrolase [Amazonocrinis nigriterrae CENA67]